MIQIFSGKGTAYEMKNISDPGSETPAAVNRVGKRQVVHYLWYNREGKIHVF